MRHPLILGPLNLIFDVVILIRGLHNLIGDGFFHQINFTLADDFHQLVLQRNDQLLIPNILLLVLVASSESLQSSSTTALRNKGSLVRFDRWMYQERIVLVWEVEVLDKMGLVKHPRRVRFHFEKIVFILPNEWNVLELLNVVLWSHSIYLWIILLIR